MLAGIAALACYPSCNRGANNAPGGGVRGSGYVMRVHGVRRCAADTLHPAPDGKHWLGVEVEIDATGQRHVPANPFYAELVDEAGHRYRSAPGPCRTELRHAPLLAGSSARGWVSFLVRDQATHLELRYAPRLPFAADEVLTFTLGS